jgi:hypothetical protein
VTETEILAEIERVCAAADARRAASKDPQIAALLPSGYDWMTEEERVRLHELKLLLPRTSRAEAQARVKAKRAARRKRMSMHDDYMDLDDAWKEYDRAYTLWGQAVDGTKDNGFKSAPPGVCRRRALRMSRALQRLNEAAKAALEGMASHGWPTVGAKGR